MTYLEYRHEIITALNPHYIDKLDEQLFIDVENGALTFDEFLELSRMCNDRHSYHARMGVYA